jgi:peroxiredoxin
MIAVGDQAPDFLLKDNRNRDTRLSDYAGKRVLLSFHPLAWSRLCAEHMKSLENDFDLYEKYNCVPLGISVDAMPSKNAWAKALEIHKTRLLADFWPHGEVARLYGVFREKNGYSERANILIDESHKVVFAKIYPFDMLPDMAEVMGLLITYSMENDELLTIKDVNPSC